MVVRLPGGDQAPLIELAPPDRPDRRVYVNASLRFDSILAVGFDLDYTLAVYDPRDLQRLAFELAAPRLCDRGYPPLVGSFQYRPVEGIRGLVADIELGNVLKVDQYDYVSIAWHGIREMSDEERRRSYANRRIDLDTGRFESVDAFFSLANLELFQQLVALAESFPAEFAGRSTSELWRDVAAVIDEVHQDGTLKAEVLRAPANFLLRDPDLPAALRVLRDEGKRLFLLTNSEYEYTDGILSFLLDGHFADTPGWVDYFDEVVVQARKPAFFDGGGDGHEVVTRERARRGGLTVRSGGGYRDLQERLGCVGDQILFAGDHLYGDVIRSKRGVFWRTLMILPELDSELTGLERNRRQRHRFLALLEEIEESDERCARLRNELAGARRGAPDEEADVRERYERAVLWSWELQEELQQLERAIDRGFHPRWGALLNVGAEVSRFGREVQAYADLYSSRVSNLARYPAGKFFQSPWDSFPHSRMT